MTQLSLSLAAGMTSLAVRLMEAGAQYDPREDVISIKVEQLALDWEECRARRDAGIARTMNAESDAWKASALDGLRRYVLLHNTFTMEAFRYEWMASGREPPHDHHVWGGLAHAARAAGIIEATGDYRKAASPGTHSHPVAVWRRA